MSVEQTKIVDLIGEEKDTGGVTLFIMDHLSWDDGKIEEHIFLLQEKINSYLRFIESGEILAEWPSAKDKNVAIEVRGKFAVNNGLAEKFYEHTSKILADSGFGFRFVHVVNK